MPPTAGLKEIDRSRAQPNEQPTLPWFTTQAAAGHHQAVRLGLHRRRRATGLRRDRPRHHARASGRADADDSLYRALNCSVCSIAACCPSWRTGDPDAVLGIKARVSRVFDVLKEPHAARGSTFFREHGGCPFADRGRQPARRVPGRCGSATSTPPAAADGPDRICRAVDPPNATARSL